MEIGLLECRLGVIHVVFADQRDESGLPPTPDVLQQL
jgi:hypothetical protein